MKKIKILFVIAICIAIIIGLCFFVSADTEEKITITFQDTVLCGKVASELRAYKGSSLSGHSNYFKAGITYNRISSSKTGFRYTGDNAIPNMAGLMLYVNDEEKMLYCLAWLNSEVIRYLLNITNPTINFPPGTIGKLPFETKEEISSEVTKLAQQNVDISKDDWDSFETSWDFKKHPLI